MVAEVAKGNRATGTETVTTSWPMARSLRIARPVAHHGTEVPEYRRDVVKPELGKIRLSRLSAHDLNRLYAKLTAKGNKATTVRRVHALLSAALHYAENGNMVDRNVARKAQPPAVQAVRMRPRPRQRFRPSSLRPTRPSRPWRPSSSSRR